MKLRKAKRFNTVESYAACVCMHSICTCTCSICGCTPTVGSLLASLTLGLNVDTRVGVKENMENYSYDSVEYS